MPRIYFETEATKSAPERRPWVQVWDDPPMWARRRVRARLADTSLSGEERAYQISGLAVEQIGGDWRGMAGAFDPAQGGKEPAIPTIYGMDKDARELAIQARCDFMELLGSGPTNAIWGAFEKALGLREAEEKKSDTPPA